MKKTNRNIRIIAFIISIVGFLDLLINTKSMSFLNSKWSSVIAIFISLGLIIVTLTDLFGLKIKEEILKKIKITVLILFLPHLSFFLKQFVFIQKIEYLILILITSPILWLLNDVLIKQIKTLYLMVLGVLLLLPTLVFFEFIYVPYEDYTSEGLPIVFVHFTIRNWCCYIGVLLILISILRLKFNKKEIK